MKPGKTLHEYFEQSGVIVRPEVDGRILSDAFRAFEKSEKTKPAEYQPKNRRMIMKRKLTRYAAAIVFAVILLGILNHAGVFHRTGVVWAEVAKNVSEAKSFLCWELISEKDLTTQEVQERLCKHFVSPYGVRTDSYQDEEVILSSFMNYKDKKSTILVYPMKQYLQIALPEEELEQFAARSRQDGPDQIINIFLTSSEYKTIGRKNIEGVEAEGIETHDSSIVKGNREIESFSARLWVSVEDGYPVLLEYDITEKDMPRECHLTIDGFEWNVDMPESDFIAKIPEDFEKRE